MSKIDLPAVFNHYPRRAEIAQMDGIRMVGIALKIARNIHIRCRLGEAQNWRCCWCGVECRPEPGFKDSATIEHVLPRSKGGADHWDNYAMACASCNHHRGNASVEEMLAGIPKKKSQEASKREKRQSKMLQKYVDRAKKRNIEGWFTSDGDALCKKLWVNSLRMQKDSHKAMVAQAVWGDDWRRVLENV